MFATSLKTSLSGVERGAIVANDGSENNVLDVQIARVIEPGEEAFYVATISLRRRTPRPGA